MDTIARSVVYQHLFAQNCIFYLDTIGYNGYNLKITVDYQGLFKQNLKYHQKASNTNNLRGART